MDANLKRCEELFSLLLRAGHSKGPINRDLLIGAAECGAYLLSEVKRLNEQTVREEQR